MKRLIAFKLVSWKAGHEGKVIIPEYSLIDERKLDLDAAKVIKALPNFRFREFESCSHCILKLDKRDI